MEKIEITRPRDLLIAEEIEGGTIKGGCNMFCGFCGGLLGVLIEEVSLPEELSIFFKFWGPCELDFVGGGLWRHDRCGKFFCLPRTHKNVKSLKEYQASDHKETYFFNIVEFKTSTSLKGRNMDWALFYSEDGILPIKEGDLYGFFNRVYRVLDTEFTRKVYCVPRI